MVQSDLLSTFTASLLSSTAVEATDDTPRQVTPDAIVDGVFYDYKISPTGRMSKSEPEFQDIRWNATQGQPGLIDVDLEEIEQRIIDFMQLRISGDELSFATLYGGAMTNGMSAEPPSTLTIADINKILEDLPVPPLSPWERYLWDPLAAMKIDMEPL